MRIVRACNELDVPFLPRGAGTSLAGGCLAVGGGVVIALTRMKRILEVNCRDRYAVVEPGVVNLWLTNAVKPHGYHFAPDPSSQGACTVGGNAATNSGGPHTLKYGVTVNHVLGLELVLPDGTLVQTGGPAEDNPGYDLTGVTVGSEGTFGVTTKVWCRLTRNPESYRTLLGVFETVDDATNTISDLIGAGIVPAALEMLDRLILQAVEAAFHFGFPLDAGAVLIMEVDGLEAGLEQSAERIVAIARQNNAREVRRANTDAERPCCGSRASRLSAPSADWRLPTARRMAWCHAPSCRTCCDRFSALAPSTICASATSSTPVMATSIPFCCSTSATPTRCGACCRPVTRFWTSASRQAAASRASTASAWRNWTSCRSCSHRRI